jgi:hypothetical protein
MLLDLANYLFASTTDVNTTIKTVRIKVSHHNKIKQDRHYCIYIRSIISIIRKMFRLLLSHLQAVCIPSISYCCQYEFILWYNKTNVDTIVSILFYFVVVTDLNPYSIDTQQDVYDKSKNNNKEYQTKRSKSCSTDMHWMMGDAKCIQEKDKNYFNACNHTGWVESLIWWWLSEHLRQLRSNPESSAY